MESGRIHRNRAIDVPLLWRRHVAEVKREQKHPADMLKSCNAASMRAS